MVVIDPLDTAGLAPSTTSRSVRSISAMGMRTFEPNIRHATNSCGNWSIEDAEKKLRVSRTARSSAPYITEELCAAGLPMYIPMALGPCADRTARNRRPISRNASSQPTGSKLSPTRRIGVRSRSGSWCRPPIAVAFGQM